MATIRVTPDRVRSLLSSFLRQEDNSKPKDSHENQETTTVTQEPNIDDKSSPTSSPTKPRDRDAYFKRVMTFTSLSWFAKPPEVCPLICARYGWHITDVDLLQCVSCKSMLSARLPSPVADPQVYADCCKKLEESLTKGHTDCCPWPANPSPEHFATVPSISKKEAADSYMKDVTDLLTLGNSLPFFHNDKLEQMGIELSDIEKLITLITSSKRYTESNVQGLETVLHSAAILAVCGWHLSAESSVAVLRCSYCQRELGLWHFTSLRDQSEADGVSSSDDEPPSKRPKASECLNPVEEHRGWCPWVTKQKANGTSSPFKMSQSPSQGSPRIRSLFSNKPDQRGNLVSQSAGSPVSSCALNASDSSDLPGWKRLLCLLLSADFVSDDKAEESPSAPADVKETPSRGGLRNVWSLFTGWATPKSKVPASAT